MNVEKRQERVYCREVWVLQKDVYRRGKYVYCREGVYCTEGIRGLWIVQ